MWRLLNEKYSSIWTPYGNLALDDKANAWKGRSIYRIYRQRKPFPWAMLEYITIDEAGWIVAFIPRYGDFASVTKQYQQWKERYDNWLQNKGDKPPAFKRLFPSASKTNFNLHMAINFLLSRLPDTDGNLAPFIVSPWTVDDWSAIFSRDISNYQIYCDREFSSYWHHFRQFKGLGYTLGIASGHHTHLFRDNLAVGLKIGDWHSLTDNSEVILTYSDPQGSVCHWVSNRHSGEAVACSKKQGNKQVKKQKVASVPTLIAQYRKHFSAVDSHNSKAKKFFWPHRIRKVKTVFYLKWCNITF